MTITATIKLSQTPALPVVGQRVTLGASNIPVLRRIRWRLISAPSTSALVVYTTRNLLYLDSGVLEPDIEGKYILDAVEESFVSHIPHFLGDAGATKNPVEEWTEVASSAYNVYVGCKMERVLGVAPDQVTLTMHCHDSDSTAGILTAYYDETLAPTLSEPTSDRARVALGAPDVIESLVRIGGKGYLGVDNIISTDGLTAASALQSPYYVTAYHGLLDSLITAVQYHIERDTNAAHGAADPTSAVTATSASSLPSLLTLLTDIASKCTTHLGKGATTHPNGADIAAITAPTPATTLAMAIALANDIRSVYEGHRMRTSIAHSLPGDSIYAARVHAQECWDLDSCIELANDIKTAFNSHITHVSISSVYHAAPDTDNSPTGLPLALDGGSLIVAANALADYVNAHVSNIKLSDLSAASYHYLADTTNALDKVSRASNEAEGIALVDAIATSFLRHVDQQGPWHGGAGGTPNGCTANAGNAWIRLWGVTKLNYDFSVAARAADLGAPANGLTSQRQLITIGGFAKG